MIKSKVVTTMKDYIEACRMIKSLQERQTEFRDTLKEITKGKRKKILDLGFAGAVFQKAERETIDKKEAKKLLGEIQYKAISKITKYEMFRVYTDKDKWTKYVKQYS